MVLGAWSAFIDDVLDCWFEWTEAHKWAPGEDSPWAHEEAAIGRALGPAGAWERRVAQNLTAVPSTLMSLCSQYLEAIRALLDAHEVIASLPPLVRSTFEGACRVGWLLEPLTEADVPRLHRSPARARTARMMLVQVEDFTRLKVASVGLGDPLAPRFGKSLRDLRRIRIPGMFYESEIVKNQDGSFVICGQSLPGFSDGSAVFERVTGLEWSARGAYAFLSNASHPTPHVILHLTKTGDAGLARFELEDIGYVTRLVRFALVPFLVAWQLLAAYAGWDLESVHRLMDDVDALEATPEGEH